MDHQRALRRLRSNELLNVAFDFAVYDRMRGDSFYNPFEIQYSLDNREVIISEIIEELVDVSGYRPRVAFAYFPPKNDLCDRRMIYIPIKDLIVRYGIAMIFSDEIEQDIHDQCFANRRATGTNRNIQFTEDFASGGWSRFCHWQREQCNNSNHSVLIRTDISSFYDSISHSYLLDAIERHLMISLESPFMLLFKRLLEVEVIYYSQVTGRIEGPTPMKHGLPIGDGVEGYLANLYLKDLDDAMTSVHACYGRYVDDIRLFGSSRNEVFNHLRIIQETLLKLGLNLNASKTKIAENEPEMLVIRSSNYQLGYFDLDEDENAGRVIREQIDQTFEDFNEVFSFSDVFNPIENGRNFCKYLSAHNNITGNPILPLSEREIWHIDYLSRTILEGRGSSKHAIWLLVQSAFYRNVVDATQEHSCNTIIHILENVDAFSYAKYRIVHHLLKKRGVREISFINYLRTEQREAIYLLIPQFLSGNCFLLNLIGLYLAKFRGDSFENLQRLVRENCRDSNGPIRNAIAIVNDIPIVSVGIEADEDEPDNYPQPY
jgi:hypothetical protein